MKTMLSCLVASLALGCLAGCAGLKTQVAPPYDLDIRVAADANHTADGAAAPILIALYELKSESNFSHSDYPSLQDDEKNALGEDWISGEQLILRPGGQRRLRRPGNAQARWLGVAVGYREQNKPWKTTIALPPAKDRYFELMSGRKRYRIEIGRDGVVLASDLRKPTQPIAARPETPPDRSTGPRRSIKPTERKRK